jgi:hypothetical protein
LLRQKRIGSFFMYAASISGVTAGNARQGWRERNGAGSGPGRAGVGAHGRGDVIAGGVHSGGIP